MILCVISLGSRYFSNANPSLELTLIATYFLYGDQVLVLGI